MTIAAANNFVVMMGDIGNTYLNTNTEEKIYTRVGAKFELVGIMDEGNFLEVINSLYGLPNGRNRWHAHLSYALRKISFKLTRFDLYVWIAGRKSGYDYIGTHSDDVLLIVVDPTSIFNRIKENYMMKYFGAPKVHLGCD